LRLDFPSEYRYRGERHAVPVGSLSIGHPDEAHSGRDLDARRTPALFRRMYADTALLREAEISGQE
jgi:hypothetical protein